MNRKTWMLIILLGVALLGTLGAAYRYMSSARADAASAREDMETCYKLAAQIESQSNRPTLAAEHEDTSPETTKLIEQSALSAGIGKNNLTSIVPEAPQRLGESDYKEKPTAIRIENVSLQQLTGMLHAVSSSDKGLLPKSIRLTAPRDDNAGGDWTAEVNLTYLIYSPSKSEK